MVIRPATVALAAALRLAYVAAARREWLSLAVGFAGIMILMGGPSLQGEPLHLVLLRRARVMH